MTIVVEPVTKTIKVRIVSVIADDYSTKLVDEFYISSRDELITRLKTKHYGRVILHCHELYPDNNNNNKNNKR